MEEREAAAYQQLQSMTSAADSAAEDDYYERLSSDLQAIADSHDALDSQLGWTYVDYMKAAGLDQGLRTYNPKAYITANSHFAVK